MSINKEQTGTEYRMAITCMAHITIQWLRVSENVSEEQGKKVKRLDENVSKEDGIEG